MLPPLPESPDSLSALDLVYLPMKNPMMMAPIAACRAKSMLSVSPGSS